MEKGKAIYFDRDLTEVVDAGGSSPQLDKAQKLFSGMYEAVTAPYLEGDE